MPEVQIQAKSDPGQSQEYIGETPPPVPGRHPPDQEGPENHPQCEQSGDAGKYHDGYKSWRHGELHGIGIVTGEKQEEPDQNNHVENAHAPSQPSGKVGSESVSLWLPLELPPDRTYEVNKRRRARSQEEQQTDQQQSKMKSRCFVPGSFLIGLIWAISDKHGYLRT